jgi:hypothetical protein
MSMRRSLFVVTAVSGLLGFLAPLQAHHSFAAEYDRDKGITLTGTVTKVEWTNPHVYFYIDAKDQDGKVTNWAIELGNPAGLVRRGWKKEALTIGGTVTIVGSLARNGSSRANASTVTLDGKRLFAGSSGDSDYGK